MPCHSQLQTQARCPRSHTGPLRGVIILLPNSKVKGGLMSPPWDFGPSRAGKAGQIKGVLHATSASDSLCYLILTITTVLGDRNHYPHSTDEAFKIQRIGSENARDQAIAEGLESIYRCVVSRISTVYSIAYVKLQ